MTPRDEVLVQRDDVDRLLAAWFEADAPRRAPETVVTAALVRTTGARQRPRWLPLGRWPSMQSTLRLPLMPTLPRAAWGVLLVALLVALAVAALAIVGAHHLPPPFGPAKTGLIAFDAGGDVWVANADGSNRHAITSGPAIDSSPVWSLDGEHIAYFSKATPDATVQSIVVVDSQGRQPWIVATPAHVGTYSSISWAPDGRRLVYVDHVQPTSVPGADLGDLAVADIAARTTMTITHGLLASDPAWSPDGKRIAFKVSDPRAESAQLYLVNADGSYPHRPTALDGDSASFSNPQWAPGGRLLLVWTGTIQHDVYVVDADSGRVRDLTNTADAEEFWATWSNDGTRIAYETFRNPAGPLDDVFVMNADGSNRRKLTNAAVTGNDLFWSPDDRYLVGFDSNGLSSSTMYVIPVDGTTPPVAIPAANNSLSGTWQRLAP